MSDFRTIFYEDWCGIEFFLDWGNERRYRKARAFLDELTGGGAFNNPDYYLLENKQQYFALRDFRRELDRQEELGGG